MSISTEILEKPVLQGADEFAANTLAVVGDELMDTIRSAHAALEDCVDGRGGSSCSS